MQPTSSVFSLGLLPDSFLNRLSLRVGVWMSKGKICMPPAVASVLPADKPEQIPQDFRQLTCPSSVMERQNDPESAHVIRQEGGWLIRLLFNDPERRLTVGIAEADSAGAEFAMHVHNVEEWIICYSGSLEITDEDGTVTVLTPQSAHYYIRPGDCHKGKSILSSTKAMFINRPSDPLIS